MANYLPVLLVSVTTSAIPDDSSLSTQPRGQVDYLSHEWREEDVWRSWRNMTRQKNEIANGVRLENASWRTWWKQRNKLKTVSPETLNWLKDSDVTWLTVLCTQLSIGTHPLNPGIPLRHSIHTPQHSDLLTSALPNNFNHTDDDPEDQFEFAEDQDDIIQAPLTRPPLLHTKSDSNVTRWSRNSPFRKDSPPRIAASVRQPRSPEIVTLWFHQPWQSARVRATQHDLNACPSGGKKKHITFNTFVTQFIAIDSPPNHAVVVFLERPTACVLIPMMTGQYEEDSEIGFNDPDDALDEGELFSEGHNGSDSDEEGEILEMRPPLGRSRSSSSSRSPGALEYSHRAQPPFSYPQSPPIIRTGSSDKEHVTIAPIAPTLLKTTGVGNHFVVTDLGGRERTTFVPPVNLVYVPSFGNGYALPRKNAGGVSNDGGYRHKGSRFTSSPGTSTSTSASSSSRSPPPPIPVAEAFPDPRVSSPPSVESPMGCHDDLYDYFGSAAAAQVFSADLPINMRQADLGADFGPETGALGVHLGRAVDMPEVVVVNDETGAIEERCEGRHRSRSRSYSRSHSRSHSRTPSPAEPMSAATELDTARIRSTTSSPPSQPSDPTHLSPPDSFPMRGRTPPGVPSRSRALSNEGHSSLEHCRGRSVTRNSSFSDRDRSSSRTSLVAGTGSPLGSASPTGPRAGPVGNSIYAVYSQGLNGARRESESAESSKERGRGRTDHRASVSETSASPSRTTSSDTSPDDCRSSDATIVALSPVLSAAPRLSPAISSYSLPVASPEPSLSPSSPSPHAPLIVPKPTPVKLNIAVGEDRHPRSASNSHSPSVLRHISVAVPAPPAQAPASVLAEKPQSPTLAPSARDSLTPPSSPGEHGTLVGRAAEIVSTARGIIGALWSGSNGHSPGVP
ncbi:hypothetical protein EI94DRAFT_1696896 [Lactarius quietus]|nr:hypothetical protein EI94DRAFT_1696896 [Lactarius quietus]